MLLITLSSSTSFASWTRYQNYKIKLDVPTGWKIERDLFGMPITVLGPERNGERAVLSVQHTPVIGMEFNHQNIIKTKNQYYEGRKKWADSLEDASFLSEIPYQHLKLENGSDGFEMGFRYHARNLDLEEKSIQLNCGNRLFLIKTLSSNKIPETDSAELAKLVSGLDCVSTTSKDGAYEPSVLQDFDRKFKDQISGTSPWPTKQQIKDSGAPEKAVMLEALVEFYKNYESSGGEDSYSYNPNPAKDQYFAKIKDRTDRIFSIFLSKAIAKDGYDCFFGGWPSKFIKKNGVATCGYPWETNSDYSKNNSACGEGKLGCNPSLFGSNICVDVSNSSERSHATLSCEMGFRSSGKSYEDVVKSSDFDQSVLNNTLNSAKEVCSQEPYISANYGLCSTLKEKLGISISSGKHAQDESDVKFINGLEEMKPENFDEYVKATEKNYKEFEARCIDEKGDLKTNVEGCLEDHLAILNDLKKIDKRSKSLGQELQEEDAPKSINNGNCSKADCSSPTVESVQPKKDEPSNGKCTAQEEKRKKEKECNWSKGMFMAGSCAWNVITSMVSSLWGTIKAIGELAWDGVKWVGNKSVQGAKWLAGLVGYEDESSKKINTAAQTSNSAIESFKKDPMGSTINLFKSIYDGVVNFVSTDVACEKWSGVPHNSTCLMPASSWKCMPCMDRMDTVCSTVGYVAAEFLPAFFTGGATSALKGSAIAAKVGGYLGKVSKLGKLTRLEADIIKITSKATKVERYGLRAAKYESEVLKAEIGIAGNLSKTQKIIGKVYNVSRWPVKQFNKIKSAYTRAKNVLTGFKSKTFGSVKNTIEGLQKLRKKYYVVKAGSWVVENTVVQPLKLAAKIATAPIRYPMKWTNSYVRTQAKIYKVGLKFGEKRFNDVLVKSASMSKYPTLAKNIALYSSLSKYPAFGSHMLDEFRERLSMKDDNNPNMFWKSSHEIEVQAKLDGKNPQELKSILKKNRIDLLTNTIVMDALNSGKDPKEVDLKYLSKIRGISNEEIRVESIDSRLQAIANGTVPTFTQSDYDAIAKINKISSTEAKNQIQNEVKIQVASSKVINLLNEDKKPEDEALKNLASLKKVNVDEIVIESIDYRINSVLGGVKPKFSNFDYETWARVNHVSIEEAKKYIDSEVQDSLNMISDPSSTNGAKTQ